MPVPIDPKIIWGHSEFDPATTLGEVRLALKSTITLLGYPVVLVDDDELKIPEIVIGDPLIDGPNDDIGIR